MRVYIVAFFVDEDEAQLIWERIFLVLFTIKAMWDDLAIMAMNFEKR